MQGQAHVSLRGTTPLLYGALETPERICGNGIQGHTLTDDGYGLERVLPPPFYCNKETCSRSFPKLELGIYAKLWDEICYYSHLRSDASAQPPKGASSG